MSHSILERIEENPVIAAIRREEDLARAVQSAVTTIFLLHTDIFTAEERVRYVKKMGKTVLVHIDFIEGLGRDTKAIDYVSRTIRPDGVITTRAGNIKYLKELGMFTVQRFFMVDSQSYDTAIKTIGSTGPDMVEILPGVMPRVVTKMNGEINRPIIAGGMIDSKEDILEILKAGAMGVSVGKRDLWEL